MLIWLRNFTRSVSGVAATEFAIVFPMLMAFFLGVVELSNYMLVDRRANFASHFVTEYLSRDPDNMLTDGERIQAQETWAIINPTANDPDDNSSGSGARTHAYGYASISFEKTDPDCEEAFCDREPVVHWTFYSGDYRGIEGIRTSCDLSVVANSVEQDGTTVPLGMVGRGPIIMADTTYRYEPLLAKGVIGLQEKTWNVIRKTRTGMRLDYDVPSLESSGHVQRCP